MRPFFLNFHYSTIKKIAHLTHSIATYSVYLCCSCLFLVLSIVFKLLIIIVHEKLIYTLDLLVNQSLRAEAENQITPTVYLSLNNQVIFKKNYVVPLNNYNEG